MSGKYSGLPDIDSAPDIYETTEEPQLAQNRVGTRGVDSDLTPKEDDNGEETKRIPTGTNEDIDWGDLPSRKKVVKVFTEPADRASDPPPESSLSRLRRLQSEVAQLERELQNTPAVVGTSNLPRVNQRKSVLPARQPVDIVSELSSLRERLNAASDHAQASSDDKDGFSTRLRQLEEVSLGEKAPALPPSTTSQSGQVGDVDKRLAILERAVGVADTESDNQISLSDTLARLDHFMNVLTQPRHLDSIARRVKVLLTDLDRAAASRRPGAPSSPGPGGSATLSPIDLERLQSLFALLPRLDPLLPVIPPLLTRLRSLSTLHAESISIAEDLRELQSSDRTIGGEERELRAIVSGVQQGMSDATTSISKNWESLQSRLKTLDDKLAQLQV